MKFVGVDGCSEHRERNLRSILLGEESDVLDLFRAIPIVARLAVNLIFCFTVSRAEGRVSA